MRVPDSAVSLGSTEKYQGEAFRALNRVQMTTIFSTPRKEQNISFLARALKWSGALVNQQGKQHPKKAYWLFDTVINAVLIYEVCVSFTIKNSLLTIPSQVFLTILHWLPTDLMVMNSPIRIGHGNSLTAVILKNVWTIPGIFVRIIGVSMCGRHVDILDVYAEGSEMVTGIEGDYKLL